MQPQQSIKSPFGITVFGSAISRVSPDVASIKVSVARLEQKPSDAFSNAHTASQAVQEFLRKAHITEFGASRVTLAQQHRYFEGATKFLGYQAKISFHVLLTDLDRVEEILTGLVGAGANEVEGVSFETTRLKELRAEVRRSAVASAFEKAANYCLAAGVNVGAALHIEDVDPNLLRGNEGHVAREPQIYDEGEVKAFDPSSIIVGAAVLVAYEIRHNT